MPPVHGYGVCRAAGAAFIVSLVALCDCLHADPNAETQRCEFDVPAGEAISTLKLAADQAQVEFIFSPRRVKGVRTASIKGEYFPQTAFELMLADAPLAVIRHRESGVFTVKKAANKPPSDNPVNDPDMIKLKDLIKKLTHGIMAAGIVASHSSAQDSSSQGEEVFELSPFTVDSETDSRYRATNTLAGTRLNSSLNDLAGAIDVVTEAFMQDIGATDTETLLAYTTNTETGGYQGNYSQGDGESQRFRAEPEDRIRVRGIGNATRTRNFFATKIPFDSYNTSRVTINRGPNSLLFGLGEPGGIIDRSTATASPSSNFGSVSLRVDGEGGYRTNFKYNRSLLDTRLGVFAAILHERRKYPQKPAYQDSDRLYLAATGILNEGQDGAFLGDTIFRANFETGEMESERPQNNHSSSALRWWFEGPDPARYAPYGITVPDRIAPGNFQPKFTFDNRVGLPSPNPGITGSGRPGWGSQAVVTLDSAGGPLQVYPGGAVGYSGNEGTYTDPETGEEFQSRIWQQLEYAPSPFKHRGGRDIPYSVFDLRDRMLIAGGLTTFQDFDAYNITLEQQFLDGRGGLEYSYDSQDYTAASATNGVIGNIGWMYVDINEYLPGGSPNPNLGRPYVHTHVLNDGLNGPEWSNDVHRLTSYYDLDLTANDGFSRHMGRHVFTGLHTTQSFGQYSDRRALAWDGPRAAEFFGDQNISSWNRRVRSNIYVGPSLLDVDRYEDVRLTGATVDRNDWTRGAVHTLHLLNENTGQFENVDMTITPYFPSGNISLEEIDSTAFAWQGYLFDDHIVGVVGWRNDKSKRFQKIGGGRLPDGTGDPSEQLVLREDPSLEADGDTITTSLVAHLPESWNPISKFARLSFHYGESENFSPGDIRININGDQIAPLGGTTKEYGMTFSSTDNKVNFRVNFFETSVVGQTAVNTGGTNNYFNVIRDTLRDFVAVEESGVSIEDFSNYAFSGSSASYGSWDELYNATKSLIAGPVAELYDLQVDRANFDVTNDDVNAFNINGTRDVSAEGVEISLNAQLIEGFSLHANVAKQEAVRSNPIPVWGPYHFERVEDMQRLGFWDMYTNGWANLADPTAPAPVGESMGFQDLYYNRTLNGVISQLASDGQLNAEIRKWRANAVLRYQFSEDSRLKGFAAGMGLRWQDKIAIGYPIERNPETGLWQPDLENPYMGPDEFNGDVFLTYETKLQDYPVSFQLNARNIIGSQDQVPFNVQPDGVVDRVRNPPLREYFLTTTLSF